MPLFNWTRFLSNHNIQFTDRGRNVTKGNVTIKCPFCGAADPSMHLSISTKGYGWRCWRNGQHQSKSSAKLVQRLLNCSWAEAIKITGGEQHVPPTEGFGEHIKRMLYGEPERTSRVSLPPKCAKLVEPSKSLMRPLVVEYMRSRGYSLQSVLQLATRYDLHYANVGEWRRRVILPIRNEAGELVNYTGRAISDQQRIRYKTLPRNEATRPMSSCILDADTLFRTTGEVLVVNEGPFDAIRMGWFGEPLGIFATCVFTSQISGEQAGLLRRLAYRFKRRVVLFDEGAELNAFRAANSIDFERMKIPAGIKDPGTLTTMQGLQLCRQLLG